MRGDFRKVVLPNSLEIIEEDAFKGNDLSNIEIPKGVTQIGNGAFQDNNISKITIPHGVTNIGDNAFGGNGFGSGGGLIIIYNKPGNVTLGDNAFGGGTPVYQTPTAQEAGIVFYPTKDSDGNNTGSIISRPPDFKSEYGSVVIPEYIQVNGEDYKVTEVHTGAYQGAGIISVKFPEGLERIEDYAFAGNQMVNVILPNSIVHVGNYAFAFNELVGEKGPSDVKGTIKVVEVKQQDYFKQIDVNGNIIINGVKAETISGATMLDHIFVTSDNPHVILERPVAVISAGEINQITSGKKVNWSYENSVASNGGTIVSAEWKNKQDIYSSKGDYQISLRVKDNSGTWSNWVTQKFTISNSSPTTPVITRSPGGNVRPGTPVKITAVSTDPDGDELTYVWEGRDKETQVYPKGRNIVTVHTVDSAGAESAKAAIVFVVADASGGGMLLTGPESTIIEEGIPGATISNFTFNVPSVSGHSGADYGQIRGWNVETNAWELIERRTVSNGITMTGAKLPAGKYSKLEMFYYASHCMYNKSNITYEVDFHFE